MEKSTMVKNFPEHLKGVLAQAYYDPAYPDGRKGSEDNHHYRKAVTTEILQNVYPYGDLRADLMHRVWESV